MEVSFLERRLCIGQGKLLKTCGMWLDSNSNALAVNKIVNVMCCKFSRCVSGSHFFLCFCYQGVVGIEGALDMSIGCLFLGLIAAAYAYSAKMY